MKGEQKLTYFGVIFVKGGFGLSGLVRVRLFHFFFSYSSSRLFPQLFSINLSGGLILKCCCFRFTGRNFTLHFRRTLLNCSFTMHCMQMYVFVFFFQLFCRVFGLICPCFKFVTVVAKFTGHNRRVFRLSFSWLDLFICVLFSDIEYVDCSKYMRQ